MVDVFFILYIIFLFVFSWIAFYPKNQEKIYRLMAEYEVYK